MKIIRTMLLIFLLCFISLTLACAPNENQVRKQLNNANYCKVASDCIDIGPACPFGCQVYVNINEQAQAQRLIESYNSKCVYGCLQCASVECQDNKCQEIC